MLNFYGDNVRWFIGTVVSLADPTEMGRLKVRVIGVHGSAILDSHLPWAQTVVPITEGGTNGLGNNVGIQVGARVFGFFMDGTNSQLPLIFGSMPKYEDESAGDRSTNELARGINTITKTPDTVTKEPIAPYAAVYPHNKVTATTSGHVFEIDDTPDAERIHIYHKSGTFVEIHPNGDVVTHTKNGFKTVTGNDKIHVTGDLDITVDGNMNLTVGGNVTEKITGNLDVDAARIDLN